MKTKTLPSKHSINRSPMRRGFLLIQLIAGVACFALAPSTDAQCPQLCDSNENTAVGDSALINNTGIDNTAIGFNALEFNTGGHDNTAIGEGALSSNTTGIFNTATGVGALFHNTTGTDNTATGLDALTNNTHGSSNTANGDFALSTNTTGGSNTAAGENALEFNTNGNNNTAIGSGALQFFSGGNDNIAVGSNAGDNQVTGFNNIYIGNGGVLAESAHIRIGTKGIHQETFIAGIYGVPITNSLGVTIDKFGHLGTVASSARFKENIEPMDEASEAILVLKPVTFRYKHDLDPAGIPQFGLVAEDVEKVNPDLVARDEQGKPYTVRYEAVNAMLLNEFLKEHRKVEKLEATVVQQQKEFQATVAQLQSALQQQSAQIQKVSAQLELNKPAPQTALNNQ